MSLLTPGFANIHPRLLPAYAKYSCSESKFLRHPWPLRSRTTGRTITLLWQAAVDFGPLAKDTVRLIGCGLDVWLVQHGIRRLIVSGIRSEQCCETTARHASDCGYKVHYVTEAPLTFPMTDRHGKKWSSAEIKARTELVLDGRFARIVNAEEALAGIVEELVA